jgi:D-psicose/D-tagatose/L-ribulose 3-epimerase
MGLLKYAVHAYAWTGSWSNDTLDIIENVKELGFDLLEIPLMDLDEIDPPAVVDRLAEHGVGVCTSTVCNAERDPTGDNDMTRRRGIEYLKRCVKTASELGSPFVTGVTYSAIGRKIGSIPGQVYWERAATALKEVSIYARDFGIEIGIEPINRYESFLVNTAAQGIRLLKMIDEPNVKLHLDSYHMNIEENDFYNPTKASSAYLCHYHLSESHRGTVGTGTVHWDEIFRGLADSGYRGIVGMEGFIDIAPSMTEATCIWRKLAEDTDQSLRQGLGFLKGLESKYLK